MKTWIRLACIAAALIAALPAVAQQQQQNGGRRMQPPPPGQHQFQPQPPGQRQFQPPGRESGSDDRRGRMTPEERQGAAKEGSGNKVFQMSRLQELLQELSADADLQATLRTLQSLLPSVTHTMHCALRRQRQNRQGTP